MSIIKKVDGNEQVIANKSVIDHSQLTNRDAYGAHSISSIRKLPEKLTKLQHNIDEEARIRAEEDAILHERIDQETDQRISEDARIESNARQIDLIEDPTGNGKLLFTDYDGTVLAVRSSYLPDDDTITLKQGRNIISSTALDIAQFYGQDVNYDIYVNDSFSFKAQRIMPHFKVIDSHQYDYYLQFTRTGYIKISVDQPASLDIAVTSTSSSNTTQVGIYKAEDQYDKSRLILQRSVTYDGEKISVRLPESGVYFVTCDGSSGLRVYLAEILYSDFRLALKKVYVDSDTMTGIGDSGSYISNKVVNSATFSDFDLDVNKLKQWYATANWQLANNTRIHIDALDSFFGMLSDSINFVNSHADFQHEVDLTVNGSVSINDWIEFTYNEGSPLSVHAIKDSEGIITPADIRSKHAEIEADISIIEEDIREINALDEIQNDKIFHLESVTSGVGGYLNSYDFGTATPTQDELTQYAMQDIGIDNPNEIFNGTKVINLFDNNTWILNNTPDTVPAVFSWENLGPQKPVAIANNDGLYGLVTGSYEQFEGFIDLNGKISINGLEEALEGIDTTIGDLSNKYVTLDTDQTITGLKTIETSGADSLVLRSTNTSGTHNLQFKFNDFPQIVTQSNHLSITSNQSMHLAADNVRFVSNDVLGNNEETTNIGRASSRFSNLYLKDNLSNGTDEISIAQLTEALTITKL